METVLQVVETMGKVGGEVLACAYMAIIAPPARVGLELNTDLLLDQPIESKLERVAQHISRLR